MGGAMCAALLGVTLGLGCSAHTAPIPPLPPPDPYQINAGDTLEIIVWREQQLSGPVQVRPDGKITMPLLGDVQAAGMTPEQLAEELRQGLIRFIESPNVVVRLGVSSQRYYMIGNVSKPGMYELRPNQTYMQALAIAGGFTPFASRNSVRIIRPGSQSPIVPDYDAISRGEAPDIILQNNDTIVIP
jgi:polysaccharide export outer membrane protein